MKILVFGITGQVTSELQRQTDVSALDRSLADLSNPADYPEIIQHADADAAVIINAAAYTAVDHADENEGLATIINAVAPTKMAKASNARRLPFLHVSSDYVLDTFRGTLPPEESTAPINAFGRSKLAG
jgi:dTDP-4-dehydrorhamnose reductase